MLDILFHCNSIFSTAEKTSLLQKKSSLLQVAATLLVGAAASNLVGFFAYQRGWYVRSFIQIQSILFESKQFATNSCQNAASCSNHPVFSMSRRF